jgi:hypothetical protein
MKIEWRWAPKTLEDWRAWAIVSIVGNVALFIAALYCIEKLK